MATYLQGVTDYIPQFQPFQPDLNFYDNVMQTKQTQYDNNWKALNTMYSKYYYADLTRDSNIKARDSFIKDAQFNLKRISQLDLSLDQNVQQAAQVFRPFYENQDLMKDMAWTKNTNTELSAADSFRRSLDPEMNKKYWDSGVREINYKIEEFKNASNEEALSFSNVRYTPNVDIMGRAQDIAKEFGDIQTVKFTEDNRWIVKTKNGEQLEEPLQKLFEARLGNDPAVQAYFKTKAYVERKDYIMANAAQFNGDKEATEMKYLQDKLAIMKIQNRAAYKQMKEQSAVYDNKIADIQGQIDKGNKDPRLENAIAQYTMNKQINTEVLNRIEKEIALMETNQGDENNPYGDIQSFRYKVDSGMAAQLMGKELGEAAHTYAFRNYFEDLDANPYQVNKEKFQQNMALANQRYQNERKLAEYKAGLKQALDDRKAKLDAGTHYLNENNQLVEKFDMAHFFSGILASGTATEKTNIRQMSENVQKRYTQNYAVPYFDAMLRTLVESTDTKTGKKLTQAQINYIINGDEKKYADLNRWRNKLETSPNNFLVDRVGEGWMKAINHRFKNFISQNPYLSTVQNNAEELATTATKFDDYLLYLGESKKFQKTLTTGVEAELRKKGFTNADYLYDDNGNLRSKSEYYRVLAEKGKGEKVSNKQMAAYEIEALEARLSKIARDYLPADQKNQKGISTMAYAQARKDAKSDPRYQEIESKRMALVRKYFPDGINPIILRKITKAGNYDALTKAASEIVSNQASVARITGRTSIPGLEKLSDGSGMFGKAQWTVVNPRSSWGNYHYGQVLNNLRSQDFGNIQISTGGISVTGAKNVLSGNKAQAFLTELQREMDKGTKGFTFKMGVAPIALNNANKAAYIFQVPPELIKSLTGKLDDDGNLAGGLLTPGEASGIMENGLSFIMDNNMFNSDIYNSIYLDPLAAYVDRNNTYSWNDPIDPRYSINISSYGSNGSYKIDSSMPIFDPETNAWTDFGLTDVIDNARHNLSDQRDFVIGQLNQTRISNQRLTNGY